MAETEWLGFFLIVVLGTTAYFALRELTRNLSAVLRTAASVDDVGQAVFNIVAGTMEVAAFLALKAALWIGLPLGAVYLLVKFVKWAWVH